MPRHSETRNLPYTAAQMYSLVADVEAYPEFLPWTSAARIRSRHPMDGGEVLEADLVISFKVFRERFGSRVTLWPEAQKIDTEYLDGPFKFMRSTWGFRDVERGCEVDFMVDFEFKNAILQRIIGVVFNEAMLRVVRAFERRASDLYGKPGT
ncbi:type II toxin-antitoxin system RatA family toxin [Pseudorhodobacter sp.]|uniref:type II toxin-antitoxin system RatA family toxin n=1 Tax=Pseudorhodobacter sp. TaxID=1934400 RepID=UPI002647E278|nr:type II toxin-antitoxin system RatA family toxin [Pseudorhodobacter sp.]MDN5789079.1 type II toxin-antitoxin system RatA family toxin [Pseudorhodobacter sp.]